MANKKSEIEEGNKLIRVFMGLPESSEIVKGDKLTPYYGHYDSQWGELMPVVEKISRIKCIWDNAEPGPQDTYYPVTFGMLNPDGWPMVRFYSYHLYTAQTLIEATWKAVTDFIQFYNASNPHPLTTNIDYRRD